MASRVNECGSSGILSAIRHGYNYTAFPTSPDVAMDAASAQNQSQALGIGRSLAELVVGTLVLSVIIIMTILGNVMVVLAIFTHRPLNKVQNFLLVSLACADLAVATLVMPFHVVKFLTARWLFGRVFCQMWITFDIWLCTASILNLCVVALDRYFAIHDPINYANRRTKKLVLGMVSLVWVISGLISIPPLLGWNDWSRADLSNSCEYTTEQGFVIYSACGSFYIPLVIMTGTYAQIFLAARRRLRKRSRGKSLKATVMRVHGQKYSAEALIKTERGEHAELAMSQSMPADSLTADTTNTTSIAKMDPMQRKLSFTTRATRSMSIRKSFRRTASEQSAQEPMPFFKEKEKISISKEKKAAKTLAIIMGVFVLCWLPFFLLYVIQPFCHCYIHPKIFEATNWLGYINSSLNPVIYTIFNLDFRQGFVRILERCPCNRRRFA